MGVVSGIFLNYCESNSELLRGEQALSLFIGVYFLVFVAVNGVYPLLMSLKSNKL